MRQGYSTVTPYIHCLTYHVPFFVVRYGKLVKFSGQGVEKINDDIKRIHQSKSNKYDACLDALKIRKRIEFLHSDGCEREKREYVKKSDRYWDDEIYRQRSGKKCRINEEIAEVSARFADSVECEDDMNELSVDELKTELSKLGIKTKLRKKEKLIDLLESVKKSST